jgi:hypothetical protein
MQPSIYSDILFSDDTIFHLNRMVNHHNCCYWANDNPHLAEEPHVQNDTQVMVWSGIYGIKLFGPCFLMLMCLRKHTLQC